MARQAPLLVQRDLLLDAQQVPLAAPMDCLLKVMRSQRPVWLVAEQPGSWRPTRRSVDQDLDLQQRLQQIARRAGASFDGVLYLPAGLFTRRRNRLDLVEDLASRYDCPAADLTLIARDAVLLETMVLAGGRALCVDGDAVSGATLKPDLASALEHIKVV